MSTKNGPVVIALVWAFSVVAGFWWFEYRHWQPFVPKGVVFNGSDLTAVFSQFKSAESQPLIVHFVNPDCVCERYSLSHRSSLKSAWQHARQIEVLAPTGQISAPANQVIASTEPARDAFAHTLTIPATPAVAVWDAQGQLAYFGPYSSGAICGEGEDFVSRVMNKLQHSENPQWINTLGLGCFCPWPSNQSHTTSQRSFDVEVTLHG